MQGELARLSLKIFTVVGVSFVLRPEETDGTWNMAAVKFSIQRVGKRTGDPGDSQKEWQDISNTDLGNQN